MPLLEVNYCGTKLWEGSLRTSLDALYQRRVGGVPDRTGSNIVGESLAGLSYLVARIDILKPGKEKALIAAIEELLDKKPWIVEKVQKRISESLFKTCVNGKNDNQENIFDRGSIFLAYLLAEKAPFRLKSVWPVLPDALVPVFTDSGISFCERVR